MSRSEDDDDRVGYGRPPRHTRFKPGQSGNPRGRKSKPKTFDALLEQQLDERVEIKTARGSNKISVRAAVVKKLINEALKGNPRHLELLLRHMREHGAVEAFVPSPEDEGILAALLQPPPEQPQVGEREEGSDVQL